MKTTPLVLAIPNTFIGLLLIGMALFIPSQHMGINLLGMGMGIVNVGFAVYILIGGLSKPESIDKD